MELAFVIWVISSLDTMATFFGVLAAGLLGGAFMTFFYPGMMGSSEKQSSWWKVLTVLGIFSAFIANVMPSTKTGWMMAGGFVAQQVVTSDSAKKLGAIVEIKLQEVLDEATNAAKKKANSINKE